MYGAVGGRLKIVRARGFLTRLPNRPCTANLGLPVLEGSGMPCLGSCWPHCTVLGPQATRHRSLVFVAGSTGHCRSLLVADTLQRSLFSSPLRPDAAGRYSAPKRCRKDSSQSCALCCASPGATHVPKRPLVSQLHVPRLAVDPESRRGHPIPTAPDRIPWVALNPPNARLQISRLQSSIQTRSVVLRRHSLVLLTVPGSSWGVAAAGSRDGCLAPAPKPVVGARG